VTDEERRKVTPDQVQKAAVDVKLRLDAIIRRNALQLEVDVKRRPVKPAR